MPGTIERQAKAEANIDALWKCVFGNGQPGLETKLTGKIGEVKGELKAHIESVQRHSDNNTKEGDGLVLTELKEERKLREQQYTEEKAAREKQHGENVIRHEKTEKKVDRLMLLNASLTGALILFKTLEDMGIIHLGGGK